MFATTASKQNLEMPDDPFFGSRYRALGKLATGGMGDIYAVEHVELGRKFVAKLLRPELGKDPNILDRLRLEAQTLGRLRHPNVVTIAGFDRNAEGFPFIIMEQLKGKTLEEELAENGRLPGERAIELTLQILSGLGALHELGVVHRDIKPSNLFLHQAHGGRSVLKILDFGVARVLPSAPEQAPAPLTVPTRTGTLVGTPAFMSPEAALGRPVDVRADIYSVGLVLYVMLTGRGPFDDCCGDGNVVALAHANGEPSAPSRYAPEVLPRALDLVVLQAVAKDPGDRFRTAQDFSSALTRVLRDWPRLSQAGNSSQLLALAPNVARKQVVELPSSPGQWVLRAIQFLALTSVAALLVVGFAYLVGRWR
jgi:eukaryotic-like serine/threonine-protein kinase